MSQIERLYACARGAGGAEIELYQRSATTIRVFRSSAGRCEITTGVESGLAVRARSGERGGVGFAAVSGTSRELFDWAVTEAVGRAETGPYACDCWPATGHLPDDHDDGELPETEEITTWLACACDRLRDDGMLPGAAWVDVASTVEGWVAEDLRGSRRRVRAAARVELSALDPIIVASRSWRDLGDDPWTAILADRKLAFPGRGAPTGGEATLLFSPECAAALVAVAIRAHRSSGEEAVGPGWQIADDPRSARSLFGSEFDDVGFPTERRVLADGRRWSGTPLGQGTFRRTSFRDPPAASPASLIVAAPAVAPPASCVMVTGTTIHSLGPDWILEIEGSGLPRAMLCTSPEEIARRCVGAVGPARASHLGVVTPALLFEGLRIDGFSNASTR